MKFILTHTIFFLTVSWTAEAMPESSRNFKKGLSMAVAESCNALLEHNTSSWWYSWGPKSGFPDSFCTEPEKAESNSRNAGLEFVPMFWNSIPAFDDSLGRMVDDETHSNLQQTRYLLTFNEPEAEQQANISARQAAQMWTTIEAIASSYSVEIVAPCVTQDHGVTWYADWVDECKAMYGRECHFDYTCLHLYYQPYTKDTSEGCDSTDEDWACIQSGSKQGPTRAVAKINQWAMNYPGKPIWVTEYACAPWGSTNGCSAQEQTAAISQITPVLEESPYVFRYAWFGVYGGEGTNGDWDGNGLNENVWTGHKGKGCTDKMWIGGFGIDAGWKIQTKQQCLELADNNGDCIQPHSLSMDDNGCYCSRSAVCILEPTWDDMTTWVESGDRDLSTLAAIGELYETFGAALSTPVPTKSPTKGPIESPKPTESQSPPASLVIDCKDQSKTFVINVNGTFKTKDCDWVVSKKKLKRREYCKMKVEINGKKKKLLKICKKTCGELGKGECAFSKDS